ncbi:hypothetical protein AHF37_04003 [Paragonimus kellicotti]|nr:hypothetical protein AHF37_04003 [Paragonimus kellicotti]
MGLLHSMTPPPPLLLLPPPPPLTPQAVTTRRLMDHLSEHPAVHPGVRLSLLFVSYIHWTVVLKSLHRVPLIHRTLSTGMRSRIHLM